MQLRNIRPHSQYNPGDVVEVPDGAAFDGFHWEAAGEPQAGLPAPDREPEPDPEPDPEPEPEAPAAASPAQFPPFPKEM